MFRVRCWMFDVPNSLRRILPDPIALFKTRRAAPLRIAKNSTIILFIPADGVEQKPAIVCAAVMQGLAAKYVVWNFFDELRREDVERFGIFALREAAAFQGARRARQVHFDLNSGCSCGRSTNSRPKVPFKKIPRFRPQSGHG